MKSRIFLTTLALACAASLAAQNQKPVNWNDGIPEPYHSPSASNRPQVVERPDGANLGLPAGFAAEEFASHSDWIRPRYMLLLPNNEILLSDSGDRGEPNGAVYHMSADGKKVSKLIEGLDRAFGLQYHDGMLYVAETTSLKRYPFDASAVKTTGDGVEIYSMADHGKGHWTRSILFNDDHSKLFLTIGSGSNVDVGEAKERAALLRMNPDGSDVEIYAEGLRNIIGLRHSPESGKLWVSIQERDGLGDDLVSDYLAEVKQGGFYGWPYAYTGPNEEPRHKGVAPDMVEKTLYPDVLLGAHVAVLDMIFYTGDMFPSEYKNSLLLAFHGSWNRANRVGYKVAHIPFKDGRPQTGPQDLMTGWMLDPEDRRVWGRPVGLLQMPGSYWRSFYVSDDRNITTEDTLVNRRFTRLSGESRTVTSTNNVTPNLAPGNYFLGVILEPEGDSDPTDNVSFDPVAITITSAPATSSLTHQDAPVLEDAQIKATRLDHDK